MHVKNEVCVIKCWELSLKMQNYVFEIVPTYNYIVPSGVYLVELPPPPFYLVFELLSIIDAKNLA